MKRNMDLIRDILLEAEESKYQYALVESLEQKGYTNQEIGYHVALLVEAGFVQGANVSRDQSPAPQYLLNSVTWQGHEFLDSARNNEVWAKAKSMLQSVGGFSLPVMQSLLTELLKRKIGLE